jgi:hypothetical protein
MFFLCRSRLLIRPLERPAMTGKDWFVLGIRLAGLGILYFGIQEWLAYVVRDMLFANIEYAYYPQPNSGMSRLFHGGANVGIALLALTKAEKFADWCYGKDEQPTQDGDADGAADDDDLPETAVVEPENPVDKDLA